MLRIQRPKTLAALVEEEQSNPSNRFFGSGRNGECVREWLADLNELYSRRAAGGVGNVVKIYVPPTLTSISPNSLAEQPYRWTGAINEATAESAVWWAFGIVTELEGREFLSRHMPTVIFEYFQSYRHYRLEVRYDGVHWIVESWI